MSEDETVTNCYALKLERSRTFLEIVVSYPAFCTYPEYEGKPYYAIKFEENGETIVGFGTYKIEVLSQYLKDYFIPTAEPEQKWIPVTEALPKEKGEYLISYHPCHWNTVSEKVVVGMDTFRGKTTWAKMKYQKVIAWMLLPEPWKEE